MAAPKEKLDGGLGHLHPVDPERVAQAGSRLLSAEAAAGLASLLAMMTPRPAFPEMTVRIWRIFRTGLTRVMTARVGRWLGRLR